eukprot:1810413-Rhodomonas_salina.1
MPDRVAVRGAPPPHSRLHPSHPSQTLPVRPTDSSHCPKPEAAGISNHLAWRRKPRPQSSSFLSTHSPSAPSNAHSSPVNLHGERAFCCCSSNPSFAIRASFCARGSHHLRAAKVSNQRAAM